MANKTSVKLQLSFREIWLMLQTYDKSGGDSTNKTYVSIIQELLKALLKDQIEKGIIEDVTEVESYHLITERNKEARLDLGDPDLERLNELQSVETDVRKNTANKVQQMLEETEANESIEGLDLFGLRGDPLMPNSEGED